MVLIEFCSTVGNSGGLEVMLTAMRVELDLASWLPRWFGGIEPGGIVGIC